MKYKLEHSERKPGEGESKSQWKNTKVFKRNEAVDPLFTERRVRKRIAALIASFQLFCVAISRCAVLHV